MKRLAVVFMVVALICAGCISSANTGCGTDNKPKIHAFKAFPESVEQGKQVMLSWEVSGASTVVIEPGVGPVESMGSKQVTVTAPTVYTLTASNRFGKTENTVAVAMGQSGGVAVEKEPVKGGSQGGAASEKQQPDGSQPAPGPSAAAIPGITPSGSQSQMQSLTGSYLTTIPSDAAKASGAGNLAATFWAVPNPVKPGSTARLVWTTANANRVDLLDDHNESIKRDLDKNGNYDVKPSATATFKLRVTGASETLDLLYTIKVE